MILANCPCSATHKFMSDGSSVTDLTIIDHLNDLIGANSSTTAKLSPV